MYLIRERFFDLGEDFDITDDSGYLALHVDGRMLSMGSRLVLESAAGREVASVHRHVVSMRPTYEVTVGGAWAARRSLFTPFLDKFTINVPGPSDLEVKGDLFEYEFTILRDGLDVASVSKRWFRMRDIYSVQIADGEDHVLILASVLALELALARDS
jgi:uncharacterized protein YxjI